MELGTWHWQLYPEVFLLLEPLHPENFPKTFHLTLPRRGFFEIERKLFSILLFREEASSKSRIYLNFEILEKGPEGEMREKEIERPPLSWYSGKLFIDLIFFDFPEWSIW